MPKPVTIPTWATDATYVGGAEAGTNTKVAPSGGRQAEGWEPAAALPAQELNWWKNLVGAWIAYLDGGVFDGDVEIDGDLLVDETLTVVGTSEFQADVEVNTDLLVSQTLTVVAAATFQTDVSVGQDFAVTGISTFLDEVSIVGDVTLSGALKHGDRVLVVSSYFGQVGSNWSLDSTNGGMISTGAGNLDVPLGPFLVGDRVKSITFELFGDGSADLTGDIFKRVKSTAASSLSAISITDPAASWIDHTFNVTDTTIADGDTVFIRFTSSAAALNLGAIRVTYDHP